MKYIILPLLLGLAACQDDSDGTQPVQSQSEQTTGKVLVEQRKIEAELVSDGFQFTEGPLWLETEGHFIFSDIFGQKVYSWVPGSSEVEVEMEQSFFANGHALSPDGTIVSAHHDRTIKRWVDGGYENLVTEFEGKKINSPNDLVFTKSGDLYFTDPNYGITGFGPVEAPQEQPVQGIYRVDALTQNITLIDGELQQPNGVAFTSDERTMYASDNVTGEVWKYTFTDETNSQVKEKTLFTTVVVNGNPMGDGIKIDAKGRVYLAAFGGVLIYSQQGKQIGKISLPSEEEGAYNFAFGGEASQILLITSADKIYQADVSSLFK